MEAFARGLVLELASRRVTTVSPGTTDTPLLARILGEGRDAYVAALQKKLPLHRLGTAAEVGAAMVFLMIVRSVDSCGIDGERHGLSRPLPSQETNTGAPTEPKRLCAAASWFPLLPDMVHLSSSLVGGDEEHSDGQHERRW